MFVFVFTDSVALKRRFGVLNRSNRHTVHFRSCREWKTAISETLGALTPSHRSAVHPKTNGRKPTVKSGADTSKRAGARYPAGKPCAFAYLDVTGFGRKELDEAVRSLSAHVGWDITRGQGG